MSAASAIVKELTLVRPGGTGALSQSAQIGGSELLENGNEELMPYSKILSQVENQ